MPPRMPGQPPPLAARDAKDRRLGQFQQMAQQAAPPFQPPRQPKPMSAAEANAPIQRRAGPSNFVTFGQQLTANQEVAQRMAQRAGDRVEDNGASTGLLKNDAGRQALLQQAYGQATELDAAMAGAASPDYYAQLEAQYGPEAQRRAAAAATAEAKRQADARAAEAAARQQRAQAEAAQEARDNDPKRKADRIRAEDAQRPRGQMGKERWANLHGMTLEQWIEAGEQPPF